MAAYRSLEDEDHFCAMLGCYLARAPGDNHCCPGHLQLATQLSDRPFRFYGGFSGRSERDDWCASLVVFESNNIPTGVPHLDNIHNLFDRLPWNARDTFEVPIHHDRCAYLFFKQKPQSYGVIYKDGPEEMKWKANGNKRIIEHKGADLAIEGVSLRFNGVLSEKIKKGHPGWWMLTHYLYRGSSLYCMSYERRPPCDAEDKDRGSEDEEEADGKDDDDKKNAKDAEKHPWTSNPKGARTRITRPRRDMSSSVGFGRKFNSNPPNLLASGTDDGISFVSSSTSYDGITGVIAMECKSSGADDGEICVWGLPKSSEPSHFPLLKGIGSATQGGNPWNIKIQQVSSSTSYDGTNGVIAIECKSYGADDGEIWVWGLPKSSKPSHFPLLKGIGSATQGGNPWNKKVQQVSSSTSYDGTNGVIAMECKSSGADDGEICVWGLPKSSEPSHFPLLKGIGSATQGGNPWNIKVRQVSSSTSYDGTTGVFTLKWLPSRSSYLLTCVKDKQTTFSYTNTSVGLYGVEENRFGTAPLRAPKWCKHSVGFGGELGASAKGASTIQSEVSLQSLVTEQSLVKQTSEFEEEESSGSAPDDAVPDEVAEEKGQAVDGLSADLNGTGLEDTAVHAAAETHEMLEESSGPALDDAIQRALVLGDHKKVVVDQSKSANKMADALVGASRAS